MLLLLQQNMLLGEAPTLVEVPDVVGQSEASATAELEALLFVVEVQTAYSNTVPVGDVISQSPIAGVDALEGSTVIIIVSLGEAQGVGLYAEDGSIRMRTAAGATAEYTGGRGIYATDGAYRVTDDGETGRGAYAPDGSLRVSISDDEANPPPGRGARTPTGALRVTTSGSVYYIGGRGIYAMDGSLRITVLA